MSSGVTSTLFDVMEPLLTSSIQRGWLDALDICSLLQVCREASTVINWPDVRAIYNTRPINNSKIPYRWQYECPSWQRPQCRLSKGHSSAHLNSKIGLFPPVFPSLPSPQTLICSISHALILLGPIRFANQGQPQLLLCHVCQEITSHQKTCSQYDQKTFLQNKLT